MKEQKTVSYENWQSITPQLLWAYDRSLDEETCRKMGTRHDCDENSAWLVTKGEAVIETQSGRTLVRAGQWCLPPHGERLQLFRGPMELRSITFRAKWHLNLHLFPLADSVIFNVGDYPEFDRVSEEIPATLREQIDMKSWYLGFHELGLEDWLVTRELLAKWLKVYANTFSSLGLKAAIPDNYDPRLHEALSLIEKHDFKQSLSVTELAESVGIGRRQLERLFQDEIGISPSTAIDQRKLYEAKSRLSHQESSIKEVAMTLGYADLSNFGRWFKAKTGQSPRAFAQTFGG